MSAIAGFGAGGDASRKRALKACLACRSRKVRCDVSKVEQPCTNCRLQTKNCLVVGRASRLAKEERRQGRRASSTSMPAVADQRSLFESNLLPGDDSISAQPGANMPASEGVTFDVSPNDHASHQSWESPMACFDQMCGDPSLEQTESRTSSTGTHRPLSAPNAPTVVTYSHFRFLTAGNLHRIPPQDVNYLESQGCLHVPMRPMLDDFVEQYFLHVHPLVPLIDEGDFWDMYSQTERNRGSQDTMTLILFQAMLFSSCTFVPFNTIKSLGFSSLRKARGEFYRRVKLLYDMDAENSPLPLAQTALLLTAWVPPSNMTLNPFQTWLGRAIQHARTLNADHLAEKAEPAVIATKAQRSLRRLWWCCVALDRVSPLCTRYSPYIRRRSFDFRDSKVLGASDLKDEIFRSSVYDPASKQRLLRIFEIYMDLMVIVTDVLELISQARESSASKQGPKRSESVATMIQECETALDRWFRRASADIPPFHGDEKKRNLHKSVDSHICLMYIYYYHSIIAVHHFKIQHCLRCNHATATRVLELVITRNGLEDAIQNITQLFASLNKWRLIRWLPISALACMAIPLALSVVTARLSATNAGSAFEDPMQTATNQDNLAILMETMKSFFPQYDGVHLIKDAVKCAADLAQTASQSHPNILAPAATTWAEILTNDPESYLKMVMSIDLSISKGRLAEEDDFPVWLLNNKTGTAMTEHSAGHPSASLQDKETWEVQTEAVSVGMSDSFWGSSFAMDGLLGDSFWGDDIICARLQPPDSDGVASFGDTHFLDDC
ncbi:related to cutinase transcription factor 1 beta [Cephalotrichum gorgonifer]|uniref:Related to cutinase transcription factor 1 beta n=1 Tax=Cephalotrichum gorgonifer TaxID=2041049 RepID=A0AAE8SUS2_9PEZI|nr:related to cutinase transcription factor 1 beta [Cephalotrichum gorgonifer]